LEATSVGLEILQSLLGKNLELKIKLFSSTILQLKIGDYDTKLDLDS